ncbi:hypothetical protein [Novosphingobium mathurense]|uniref:Uncharacterized protein n=1 Tax=Novosphingobium mathurense TaxID=428990 RepID=A0A1U6I7K0_9SPHN|nr:hypothetical protein [Novosphingobium mathurense]SLK03975.1 hypothetical protein SAMN06295987_104317 [Novosphingobium mathurense]
MTSHQQNRLLQASDKAASEIPWGNHNVPTFTLDKQIDRARREMGEERWQQLNKEWQ